MLSRTIKVIVADLVLVVATLYVIQDLQWRSAYAESLHNACGGLCGYAPSFSYGLLTQIFTMTRNSTQLNSPLTFDWVQAIVYALVIINCWFAYVTLKSRGARDSSPRAARVP